MGDSVLRDVFGILGSGTGVPLVKTALRNIADLWPIQIAKGGATGLDCIHEQPAFGFQRSITGETPAPLRSSSQRSYAVNQYVACFHFR